MTANFEFLKNTSAPAILHELASNAERYYFGDPNTCLVKVRQLAEAFTQALGSKLGLTVSTKDSQAQLLQDVKSALLENYSSQKDTVYDVINTLHHIRKSGNIAVHEYFTRHDEALKALADIHKILKVFYGDGNIPAFQEPSDPSIKLKAEILELEKSRQALAMLETRATEHARIAEERQKVANMERLAKQHYQQLLVQMQQEQLAQAQDNAQKDAEIEQMRRDHEAEIAKLNEQLRQAQQQGKSLPKKRLTFGSLELSESDTRRLIIDEQLRGAGWEVDSADMTYAKGARPEIGKNKAIAEWPTQGRQKADYVLFCGLIPIACVEAKRQNANVSGKIEQAMRYSEAFCKDGDVSLEYPPMSQDRYHIPFVYSCNGRPYFGQLAEQSGVWFLDLRQASNIRKPLQDFHSPAGLLRLLRQDLNQSTHNLSKEPFDYLQLRDYQIQAIEAVENALANPDTKKLLIAMATGTGKTRTTIGLIYRLLKSARFGRILFLVDRTSLGNQAFDSMTEMTLEQQMPLSKIYNIANLDTAHATDDTRIHIATVQAMVRRVFESDNPPSIDAYDCIIVDESHRGYTLDQEMTDGEIEHRDAKYYLSSYRRVLEYFDAVRIGLTATPAKHTAEIFGHPIYTYSYREAVADGWLIDSEPPIYYETTLSQKGITLAKGDTVQVLDTHTGDIKSEELEDELAFDVTKFNRNAITESFNRVICQALAQEIDPTSDEKTLIFCVNDRHADMVKRLLDEAFSEVWGDDYAEESVRKITGYTDQVDKQIARFKNEKYPSIAITVDLLTTGIDVPAICNLVFMRAVKSRILYEQMKGRATRRCDKIGKTYFKIYDPIGLTKYLQPVDTMQPQVKRINIGLDVLIDEYLGMDLQKDDATSQEHATATLTAIQQKVHRVLTKALKLSTKKPKLKAALDELAERFGMSVDQIATKLDPKDTQSQAAAQAFLRQHDSLAADLVAVKYHAGSQLMPVICTHEDTLLTRSQAVLNDPDAKHQQDQDYLESFTQFIQHHLNESAALSVIIKRPSDLDRQSLKALRLMLDEQGYNEARLNTAWRNQTNQAIAASIIGHIRRAALGETLISFDERVSLALKKLKATHTFTKPQEKWLDRLATQLTQEVILDKDSIHHRFLDKGGYEALNKQFGGQLDSLVHELQDHLWEAS